jgi:hypothetical protein
VRLLLTYGADTSARTRLGTTPEKWAAARGFDEITSLLTSAGGFGAHADARARQTRAPAPAGATADSPARAAAKNPARAAGDSAGTSAGARDSAGSFSGAANVSVRRGGQVPAHPSSSAFRLGDFLRSWQASVGMALLVSAFGVAAYAVWRGGQAPRGTPRPAQGQPSPAPQAAAQPPAPAPSAPAAQASPAVQPSPDALGGALTPGAPGATYLAPNPAGQPYYVAPGAPVPGQAGAPSVPVVISESEAPSPEDASRSRRRSEGGARDAASAPQPAGGRDAGPRPDATGRDARTPDSESQPAPPARQTQPPPAPQASPTPGRGKVIQWPPQ